VSLPAAIPPLPPPIDADKIGPDNLKTEERTLLKPLAGAGFAFSSSSSPVDEDPLPPLLLLPLDEPEELPRIPVTPLLSPANVCEIAEIFGVMMPEISAWKLGTGCGGSIPAARFFSIFVLSN
jgi:hypothetical protein